MSNNSTVIKESQNQITLVEGEVRTIPVTLLLSNKDYKPFDLTGYTEIVVRFVAQNSGYLELSYTGGDVAVTNAAGGGIEFTLSAENSALLMKGDRQSFEVVVTIVNVVRIAQIIGRLNVKPRIACSS